MTGTGHDILFPKLPYHMDDRAPAATKNVQLQQFVNHATLTKDDARKQLIPHVFGEHADDVRTLAGQIKQHTLNHLDYYLEQFIDRATAAGATVHFAQTSRQANDIAIDIAKRKSAKLCVKSKSMVTEETLLLPALEAIGCETVETDLGEFILQLDHDAPSHIVTPMIHKDRTAVARAFQRELGAEYTEDAEALTRIARNYLRDKYRRADLGISGGNFLVAETGSVVICTNEGNGRLCTSVPDTHIAFVGIEKVVPTLTHLAVLLKLLARSSTAQPLTVYTHHMTGPKRRTEHDGPQEVHIVLVDNGRTQILREETREMLRCIRCGACLNACPVYRKVGGHSYGAVYSGPIGALITPMFKGLENFKDLPNASSLCGACYEACPVKIDIPKYLIKLREDMVDRKLTSWSDRLMMRAWAFAYRYPFTYRVSQWFAKWDLRRRARWLGTLPQDAHDPYADRGYVSKLPGPAAGWTDQRDMPTPPSQTFRDWWKQRSAEKEQH